MSITKIILILLSLSLFIVWIISFFLDFNLLLKPFYLIGKTNEQKLTNTAGVMYKKNGKPFTGTALLVGRELFDSRNVFYSYPDGKRPKKEDGRRVTQYKNGLKDGVEKVYHSDKNSIFGQLGGPEFIRTLLNSRTEYKQGKKHGTELLYDCAAHLEIENHYKDGLLHGISKEYDFINPYEYQKKVSRNIGPLMKEQEYKDGKPDGIYRTYTQYGDTLENYTIKDEKIFSGRRMYVNEEEDEYNKYEFGSMLCAYWEHYENGELVWKEIYDRVRLPPDRNNDDNNSLMGEEWYENGEMVEQCIYNSDNGRVKIHRQRHNGVMIDTYNRDLKIDRTAEFNITKL